MRRIHLRATREIIVVKTGEKSIQSQFIESYLWDVEEEVFQKIMNSENKIQAYLDWVLPQKRTVTKIKWRDDALAWEPEPLEECEVDIVKEHYENVKELIHQYELLGYDIDLISF